MSLEDKKNLEYLAYRCLREAIISRGKFAEILKLDRCDVDDWIKGYEKKRGYDDMYEYQMKKVNHIKQLKNLALDNEHIWKENGFTYTEVIRQEYTGNNCIIRAGFVKGGDKPDEDEMFIRLEKDGVEPTIILLRPDEMQILNWVSSGAIWSYLMGLKEEEDK